MPYSFLSMQGAGNRILVVDERERGRPPPSGGRIRELARGEQAFDQLMWLGPARRAGALASYRVFNADGSEVEQCGNGVRCVAWMLARAGGGEAPIRLEGPAGPVEARVVGENRIAVDMGPPVFEPAEIPFVADAARTTYPLEVGGSIIEVAVLSMGNPHCVTIVDDVDTADVARLGPMIEVHPRFPARVNAGFMAIEGRQRIRLRVHERGVGETAACGTGACAAAVAGMRLGRLDGDVSVDLPGGQLMVSWRGGAEPVWLTGTAELTSEGTIEL